VQRVIFHCDLNSFYASVELLSHPELVHLPVAVCGDPASRHGIILAKNEHAKKFDIKTAETIWSARRKCPHLVLLPASRGKYSYYSKQVNQLYAEFTDLVEPFGIDESWLDVTGSLHLFGGDAKALADRLRIEIQKRFGLTISVGVSYNKVFAKLGSDYKKPDATTVIMPEDVPRIVHPLPVTDLLFVGKSTARLLETYGVKTIGDLAAFRQDALVTLLGKAGDQLHRYAAGLDASPVAPYGQYTPPKSVGNGLTFKRNLLGREDILTAVMMLSEQVAMRLRKHHLKCTTLSVQIKSPEFRTISRQSSCPMPTYLARELFPQVLSLIEAAWDLASPIRALTITAQNLVAEDEAVDQFDLLAPRPTAQRQKLEQLEKTIDTLRSKYGTDAITFGSAVRDELDASSHGESSLPTREKD